MYFEVLLQRGQLIQGDLSTRRIKSAPFSRFPEHAGNGGLRGNANTPYVFRNMTKASDCSKYGLARLRAELEHEREVK